MADLTELLAYASGVYFIEPDMEQHALLATLAAIHLCDGVLCFVIARHGGRHQAGWALAGLILGIWGALPLLLQRHGQSILLRRNVGISKSSSATSSSLRS